MIKHKKKVDVEILHEAPTAGAKEEELVAPEFKQNVKVKEQLPEAVKPAAAKTEKSIKASEPLPEQQARLNELDQSKGFFNAVKKFWKPNKTILINMELRSGNHITFVVIDDNFGFKYNKKYYLIDGSLKYWSNSAKMYVLDYHEDLTIPIKRIFPIETILKTMKASNIVEVENMINPVVIERFTNAKLAEGAMKGQQIDEFFRQIRLIMIVCMISSVIHLLLFVWKTGMLQQVKLPFLN